MKAPRERGQDGLGEVPRRISCHQRALAGLGQGHRQDGERAGSSLIHPDPDGGIHAKPIDMAEDGRLFEPLSHPDNVRDVAVTGGHVDRNGHGATMALRGGIPAGAVDGQPREIGENRKGDGQQRHPRARRPRQGGAGCRESHRDANCGQQDTHCHLPSSYAQPKVNWR